MPTEPYFHFSRLGSIYDPKSFPPVAAWTWITSFRKERERPTRDRKYLRHLAREGALHSPDHREIRLFLAGQGLFSLCGKGYQQMPGTVMFFDHGEARDLHNHVRKPHQSLWLHLNSRSFIRFNTHGFEGDEASYRLLPTGSIKSGDRSFLIHEAWDRCKAMPRDPMLWEYLKTLVASVCLEILGTTHPGHSSLNQNKVVEAISQYIEIHLHENLTLEKVAAIAGYSPFFFHRMFQKHTGRTLKQTLTAARLERAKSLLLESHTLEAVSEAVGFNSPSHFSEFFKKHLLIRPGRWRARQMKAMATGAGREEGPSSS